MQYRKDKNGDDISILGFGCMRFPRKGITLDVEEIEKEIMEAINKGVNYFDTAYMYPGSEAVLGEILARNNCRDKVKIATKLPVFRVNKEEKIDEFFNEELKRLKTNHIDYYLMHAMTDMAGWEKLLNFGIVEWIEDKKKKGEIKNIGFSFHGNTSTFIQLLNAYDWDFCQIQYNYLDENSQAGREGLIAANKKGIPVIIMEPLRGGKLVNLLPEKAKRLIADNNKKWSPAEWGLRWLWDQQEVTCVLSGMNSMNMLQETIEIASKSRIGEFTEEDLQLIDKIKDVIKESVKVGCTGCGYCMPCPKGVDIPTVFNCYNMIGVEG
ncbi:MAG: aldo/keto reductase, partial [Clostridia bacterium]|nr:aldo/keto reductase [Clostridia bacterium]